MDEFILHTVNKERPLSKTLLEQTMTYLRHGSHVLNAHPVGGWHDPAEHNQVTERKNQAGEVDTGDIFLLIFASKKAQDSPIQQLCQHRFSLFPSRGIACSPAGLPACENDNCQEALIQRKAGAYDSEHLTSNN